MPRRIPPRLALAIAVLACGCVSYDAVPDSLLSTEPVAEASAPLGGEALAQRKQQMERAQRDMVHFHTTLDGLNRRNDRNGQVLFKGFLDAYMGMYLEPLLLGEWQSRHPELSALDANLRFAKAELLIQLRATSRAQGVIDDIESRYAARGDMLVDYPFGRQSTLRKALELLRSRKWRG